MTGHTKARLWAAAGIVPAICVATWATGPTAPETATLLVMAALGWGWVSAVISEHHWQTPTVKWLERRNRQLEEQLAATEGVLRAKAAVDVIDLRPHRPAGSTELTRRVEAARGAEHARLNAEPNDVELKAAEDAARSAFLDPGARYRDQP